MSFGVVVGNPPSFGYGYGAEAFAHQPVPSASYPDTPYPAQMYGYDSDEEMRGLGLGGWTDTINSIIGGVESAATNVENIARGIATGAQATQYVAGRAQQGGGALFKPSPADVAAQNADVLSLLGGSASPYLLLGGLGLIAYLLLRKS